MERVHVILKALAHPGEGLPRTQIQCVGTLVVRLTGAPMGTLSRHPEDLDLS